jgi:hypothetical protein
MGCGIAGQRRRILLRKMGIEARFNVFATDADAE